MRKISLLLLVLLLSSCATSGDYDILRREVNDLRRDSFEQKREISALKEKTAGAAGEITSLKEKTAGAVKEDSFAAVRESQADINSRLSQLSSDLQSLRGRFEENKYNVEKSLKDSASDRELIRTQIANLEEQVKALKDRLYPAGETGKAQDATPGRQTLKEGSEKTGENTEAAEEEAPHKAPTEKEVYEAAYSAFKGKKYREAREDFQSFLKEYPNSKLADSAQFWLAESYYAEKDYEGAILAYETLLKKYPHSSKTAGALLKQGYSFLELGDKKTGSLLLKKVVDKFPGSQEAGLAKKKLAEMGKKPGRKK
jgi:tol-pal system protein YbgF